LISGEIGEALGVTEKTIEKHVSNLLQKLELPTRIARASWVLQHPILEGVAEAASWGGPRLRFLGKIV
jgi:hypothetical protein